MKVLVKNDAVVIKLEGFERVWAIKKRVVIPSTSIVSLKWEKKYQYSRRLLRIAGTGAPAKLSAGVFFGRHGENVFLYLKDAHGLNQKSEEVLVIHTVNFEYTEVVVSISQTEALPITTWWNSTFRPTSPSA